MVDGVRVRVRAQRGGELRGRGHYVQTWRAMADYYELWLTISARCSGYGSRDGAAAVCVGDGGAGGRAWFGGVWTRVCSTGELATVRKHVRNVR